MPSAHGRTPRALTALSRLFTAAAPPARRTFRHFPIADLGRLTAQSNSGVAQARIHPQLVCRRDLRRPALRRGQRQTLTPLATPILIAEECNSGWVGAITRRKQSA